MNKFLTICCTLATAGGFFATAAAVQSPSSVKELPTQSRNRLYQRHFSEGSSGPVINKLSRSKFINVASTIADQNLPVIIGGLLDSNSGLAYGLYQLPEQAGGDFTFIRNEIYPNGGGVEADGYYHSCEVEESADGVSIIIRTYDTETWRNTRSFSPNDYSFIATDVAHDPVSGLIYGCLWDTDGSGYMFGTIDYINGTTRKIRELEHLWNAIAIDRDGTIYAIEQQIVDYGTYAECVKSSLYTVDKANGDMTLIGDTGLLPYYASSAVIDHRSGRMFWSVTPKNDTESALYEVDKTTGACTLIYRYPGAEQFMGFYIPAPLAEEDAPAAVSNLSASFPEGSLEGVVNFNVPTLTYGGTPGSGDISYEIYAGSLCLASGQTQWGNSESVPVSLNMGGQMEITVTLINEAGASPIEKISIFVGNDTPVAPSPSASWADGTMTLEWDAPESSINGGYIDPQAMTYNVVRYPGELVVAESISETSFSEQLPEPDDVVTYFYSVTAKCNGKTSAPGFSNRVVLGAASTPYIIDFSILNNLNDLTIINDNPDSEGWELSNGAALLSDDRLMPKDDWIITAPVRLLPGTVYAVTVKASSQGASYPENIEVKYGLANDVESMTEAVIPVSEVCTPNANTYQTLTGYIAVPEETTIFVGVHACSPADVWNLRVNYISIEGAFATTAPGAPENFAAMPDPAGNNSVSVSLNVPTVDYDGNPLSEISRIAIYRDGVEIYSQNNPQPGEAVSYIDSNVSSGEHTYSSRAFAGANPGRDVSQKIFVGVSVPVAPELVTAFETENEGEVTVTWSEVNKDANGYPINSDLISYTLYKPNEQGTAWETVASGLTGFSYTFMDSPDAQIFSIYAVAAVTSAGSSSARVSETIPVGPAYRIPYLESFANGVMNTIFTSEVNGTEWSVTTNNPQFLAQADDNGFLQQYGEYYGSNGRLISGKINLEGAVNPILSFATFNYYTEVTGPDYNAIDVYVAEAGGEWSLLKQYLVKDMADQNRWGSVNIPLEAYKGKTIRLMLHVTHYSYDTTAIDQIRVANGVDNNLSLLSISAPSLTAINSPFRIETVVENMGLDDADEFAVNLYRNGELCDSKVIESLRAGRSINLSFEQTFSAMVEEDVEYYTELQYSKDEIADDNRSAMVTVSPEANNLPVVEDLTGILEGGIPVLSWGEPDTDTAAPDPYNETFESAESYAVTSQCGWTFIDADGAPTQSAEIVLGVIDPEDYTKFLTMPGIGDGSPLGWGVIDHTFGFGHVSWFEPHAGSKLLIALAADGVANDDWAISPLLFGGEQTVSFWAKSKEEDPVWGTEQFQVLYSTGSLDPEDFILIDTYSVCSWDWKQFSFNLPEGARRFAVRYISEDTYALMIDDFSFIPEGAVADISLLGYNLYRDMELVNETPIGENMFTDSAVSSGSHTYSVTALYDKGESRGSNRVTLEASGVKSHGMDAVIRVAGRSLSVTADPGTPVVIAGLDGKILMRSNGPLNFTFDNGGTYLITVGNKISKILVR